jgi:hypothetical protein
MRGLDPAIVIPACTAVITANPSRPTDKLALSNRAVAYEKIGQNDRAMADLDEAISATQNPHAAQPATSIWRKVNSTAQWRTTTALVVHEQSFAFGHRADAYLLHGEPARPSGL